MRKRRTRREAAEGLPVFKAKVSGSLGLLPPAD
jgi:hypothetical protein